MKQEKKYSKPEAIVIEFDREDIILTSGDEQWGGIGGVDDVDVP